MTNEDKAFEFANKNADKYMNDEDPLDALRDGFLCGAQWKERQSESKSPWHKASEELPMYDVVVIVSYGNTYDCCFNHRSNNSEVKTTQHDWCEIGYEEEPTHWMEIPKIVED